ncbi:MAG: hypothetical protein JXR70_14905 [Spirochaetales bacterium]|nr:hypothetical protein [Spirochaetales bacterium]
MNKLDFFRQKNDGYNPVTPFAALKAFEEEVLGIEHFIYMSTSNNPLDEMNFSYETLDRLIARRNNPIEVNLILFEILEKLLKHRDPEIALYAAESINLIESYYSHDIEKIKKHKILNANDCFSLARIYFELSLLNSKQKSIQDFFLKEAFYFLKEFVNFAKVNQEEIKLLVEILLSLRLSDKALSIIDIFEKESDPYFLILKAKIYFIKGNIAKVASLLKELGLMNISIDKEIAEVIEYWETNDE